MVKHGETWVHVWAACTGDPQCGLRQPTPAGHTWGACTRGTPHTHRGSRAWGWLQRLRRWRWGCRMASTASSSRGTLPPRAATQGSTPRHLAAAGTVGILRGTSLCTMRCCRVSSRPCMRCRSGGSHHICRIPGGGWGAGGRLQCLTPGSNTSGAPSMPTHGRMLTGTTQGSQARVALM